MFRHLLTLTCAAIFGAVTAMSIPVARHRDHSGEAALPPQKARFRIRDVALRGSQNSNACGGTGVQTSPMRFQVKFQTFGGSSIASKH